MLDTGRELNKNYSAYELPLIYHAVLVYFSILITWIGGKALQDTEKKSSVLQLRAGTYIILNNVFLFQTVKPVKNGHFR